MMFGSLPRLRLYTSFSQYVSVFFEIISGRWHQGSDITRLEKALAERTGAKYSVFLNMARIGIFLTLKNTIQPGQNVILSPYTITEVINMVVAAGGVPVFADLDEASCNISVNEIAKLIVDDGNIGAVMVTHFYGLSCEMEAVRELCQKYDVPLLEDCAQAFGATVNGKSVGTFGRAGIFSFGLYKNVNAFYGGAIVTDDKQLVDAIRADQGNYKPISIGFYIRKVIAGAITDFVTWPPFFRIVTFNIFRYGILNDVDAINDKLKIDTHPKLVYEVPTEYLVKPSQMQARLILGQLSKSDYKTKARREHALRYREGLKDLEQLVLPPDVPDERHIYWYFPIQFDNRDKLVKYAMQKGRDITVSYHRNCAGLDCFREFERDCPVASKTADNVIYLPTYPKYCDQEIDANIAVIRSYFNEQF